MKKLVEIRTYKLKPGTAKRFEHIMIEQSVPLHESMEIDIVSHGICVHDPDSYYLIRTFDNLEHALETQEHFYASDAWKLGPRESIVEKITTDANATFWMAEEQIEALRESAGVRLG